LAVLISAALAQPPSPSPHPRATLRVGLWTLWHDKEITIAPLSDGVAILRACVEANDCSSVPLKKPTQIRGIGNRVELAMKREAVSLELAGPVTLTAHGETLTLYNPVRISDRNGELVLAVTLPVETYVERVVASESGPADSLESLKALAIVVRSYALHQVHGHADYDLCDSTHCQLLHWGGGSSRQWAARAAKLATAGETLWHHGQRAEAWFHQDCGGRTAAPKEVWPATGQGREASYKQMPWLVSRTDSYCAANGAREWSAIVSLADLTAALGAAGLVRPGWKTLAVARRGESGRAVTLTIGSTEVSAEDFRLAVGRALGWNRILSTWFEVSRQETAAGDQFVFHGRGSGHGVGLCQAGAAAMSALGHDSDQILAQYFPGAQAADEATGHSWQTIQAQGFTLQTLTSSDARYVSEVNRALGEAEAVSGLKPDAPITVRGFRSTPAFRDATLAPGWVAAFTEGNWIATQSLSTLAARKLLAPVMCHEFLHSLIEAHAAPNTPLWFREGLVEALSDLPLNGRGINPSSSPPTLRLDEVDRALAHAATEAQSHAAHRAAGWYTQRLLERYGRAQVLGWLRDGLPPTVVGEIR
jgi:stage II sporulation protein D